MATLDAAEFGLVPDTAAPSPVGAAPMSAGDFGLETADASPSPKPSSAPAPSVGDGLTSSAEHAMTMGADDIVKPAISATLNALIRPFASRGAPGADATWGQDYDRLQGQQRDARKAFEAEHPYLGGAAEIAGGLGNAAVAAPLFKAASAAASAGAKFVNYLRNIGTGAAVGGAAGFGAGEGGLNQRLDTAASGAELGGALNGLLPPAMWAGSHALSIIPAAGKVLSPAAREAATGETLLRDIKPGDIQASPVGPLDLSQATGNPAMAGKVDFAEGSVGKGPLGDLRGRQADAVRDTTNQIAPATTKANASADLINSLRAGRDVAGSEESRLWNVPALSELKVTVAPVQDAVSQAIGDLDPALRDAMSPQLKAIVGRINAVPNTTMGDLNGIRSDLLNIARRSSDGSERHIAGELADAFIDGVGKVPEIAGAPGGMPTGKTTYAYNPQGRITSTPQMGAPVQPNPDITDAYNAARDYTRQMRGLFKYPDTAASLAQRDGQYLVDPSEGAGRFFNFRNGSPEGPQNIAQLSDFVGALRQPGAGAASQGMKSAAQSYVVAALQDAAKLGEGQKFAPSQVQQFLSRNRGWMQSSGLFDARQLDLADKVMDYAGMLNRTNAAATQGNSATSARRETGKTFVDQIMNPWVRRMVELGMIGGAAHTHGALGGVIGATAAHATESAFAAAQDSMQHLMVNALSDPQVAADLMMKASSGNARFFSPQTKAFLGQWAKSLAAEESGRTQQQGTQP